MAQIKFSKSKKLLPLKEKSNTMANNTIQQILRNKIKTLEDQIERLQSGMNMFAPLMERQSCKSKELKSSCGHEQLIVSLNAKIEALESSKKLITAENIRMQKQIIKLTGSNIRLIKTLQQNQKLIDSLKRRNTEIETIIFEKQLQIKYLNESNEENKKNLILMVEKFHQLRQNLSRVENNRLIQISHKQPLIILKKEDHTKYKDTISRLQRSIKLLEQAHRFQKQEQEWINNKAKEQQARQLDIQCSDIGEEIVRLKKNIDLGLGNDHSAYTATFLSKYKEVKQHLETMITN